MSVRIVVLGADGMLGHKLFQRLREEFPGTIGTMRNDPRKPPLDRVDLLHGKDVVSGFDAGDFETFSDRLRALRPEVVVNCVGVIKQRDDATAAIPSITINALFPHRLARLVGEWGGRVIHFSTDCVFSGERGRYQESDYPDPRDLYGRTKLLGELETENALTLRTSIIGRELSHHQSLLDWFLSQNGRTVGGYRKVIYSGITTLEMANVVSLVIRQPVSGLYHVASEAISKYSLLLLVRDAYNLDVKVEPDDKIKSDRSMRSDRFRNATGWQAPSWPEMVRQCALDPTPYDDWTHREPAVGGRR